MLFRPTTLIFRERKRSIDRLTDKNTARWIDRDRRVIDGWIDRDQ